MTEVEDATIRFEAKKIALKQSKDGTVVTLVVHPSDTANIAPLWETWTGQRYVVVMAGMDDEEQPVSTNAASAAKKAIQQAGILCRDPAFQNWLTGEAGTYIADNEMCAKALCEILGINSRTEMKENHEARSAFLDIRDKFNRSIGHAPVQVPPKQT